MTCGTFGRGKAVDRAGAGSETRPYMDAEVVHLASEAQKATIGKLFSFLEWEEEKQAEFMWKRFRTRSVPMLKFSQAQKLTRILLNIAVVRDAKRKAPGVRVSQGMIRAAIPSIKARLGIDQQ